MAETIWLMKMLDETMTDRNAQTRRRWLGTCTGVAATTVLAGCFGSDDDTSGENGDNGTDDGDPDEESLGEDWPMYGVDVQNTAHQPDATGPEGDELTARPIVDLQGNAFDPPAVVGGTVYVPSTSGDTYAIDPEREEILWRREEYGVPIVHDGTVYGPADGGQMYGYDTDTGDKWEPEEIEGINGLVAPVPLDEKILVASNEVIWEVDINTGEYARLIDTPAFVGSSTNVPVYYSDMYYIARSSVLYGIDTEDSKIEWTYEPDDEGRLSDSNPAISGGTLYVNSRDQKLHAIDTDSGEEDWEFDTNSNIETSPAVANGLVYTGHWGYILAIDAETGDIEWRNENIVSGEPLDIVVADGMCYVTTRFGMSVHDATSGDLEWKYEIPDESDISFIASPAISGGTAYVPSSDETLYAVEDA